jgi:hypothetical protein
LSDSSAANWIDENFPGANERFPLPKKETPKGEFKNADLEGFSERDTFNLVNDEMPQDGKLPEQVTPRNADMFSDVQDEFLPAVKLGDKVYSSLPGDTANHVSVMTRNPEINEMLKRPDSPEPINGWVDKNGKFITSEERSGKIPENQIIAKETVTGADVVTPESQATLLKNIAKNIITSEKGTFDIGHTVYLLQKMRDHITIDPIPRMARAKVSDAAVEHAAARIATPHIVDNWLSKVFPDKYNNPTYINNFWSLLTKDNVLDGYETFLQRARDLRAEAITAIQKGDLKSSYEAEKEALKWDKAANEVASKHNLRQYDADMRAAMQNPEFLAEVDRYKQVINPELDRWYNTVKGHDPNTPLEGRGKYTDARLNLLTKEKAAEIAEYLSDGSKPMPESNYINYKNPMIRHDQFDRRAKFTGDYTDDMRLALSNVVGHRYYQVTKIRMYNDLIDKGVAIPKDVMPDRPADIQGERVASFEFDFPETSLEGKTREVKKPVWIREDIVRELRNVLNTDMATKRIKVLDGLTAVQLMQIADAVTHAKNLLAALSVSQGAKGGALGDIARGIPGVGTIDALKRVVSLTDEIMKDAPSMRAEKAFLAQNGMLRPEFPATGIQKVTHGQQFLYKIDTAVRISLNRLFDNLVEQGKALDTMENRRKMVNYAGQYNRRLMGPIMRKFADLGISPFIVAGRNFNRMGVRWVTGTPGIEGATNLAAAQMRVINLTKAAIIMSVLPMTLNTLTTGNPMGRTGTPVGAWDLGTDEKESGQHRIIDLAQAVGLRRGLRATGLDAVIEGVRSGKSNDQIAGNMMKDITSTATHPWMGPGPGFIFKAATGKQFDIRGKMEAKSFPGQYGRQTIERIRAALESTNPLLYSLAEPAFEGMGLQSSAGTKIGVVGKTIQDATGIETPGKFVDTLLKSPSGAFGVKDAFPAKGAAETMAGDITSAKLGDRGAMTKEDAERYERINKYTRPVLEAMKTGQDIPDKLLDEAAADEKLTEVDIKAIDQRIKQGTALRHKMNTLTAEEALEVYAVATPEEKQDIEDLVIKKLDGVKDQERIDKLMPRFNKVFGLEEPEPRAEGGPVQKNKPYLVGEKSPEVFVPKQDGMIIPLKKPALADTKWWNQTRGLPPEARARVFYAKLKKVSAAEQSAMFDKAETVKGFISDAFVAKLKQLKDGDVVEESINA